LLETEEQLMTARLEGRRVLITGAASGIGLATAELFAREGARLFLIDWSADALGDVAKRLSTARRVADVSDRAQVREAVAEAGATLGGIDTLVNVAGIHCLKPIEQTTDDEWDKVLGVNLTGPYMLMQAAVPHLRKGDAPSIVNISSGTALMPTLPGGHSAYVASKGGLAAVSKALAFELSPEIRVNCICPGAIITGLTKPENLASASAENSPYALKRAAQPSEVADGILYLASRESSYVTGVVLAIDGGRTFH
jgi:NAD(P)-dependent dehydrogenase (short-subunit alcohol dehydrogenase family)